MGNFKMSGSKREFFSAGYLLGSQGVYHMV